MDHESRNAKLVIINLLDDLNAELHPLVAELVKGLSTEQVKLAFRMYVNLRLERGLVGVDDTESWNEQISRDACLAVLGAFGTP